MMAFREISPTRTWLFLVVLGIAAWVWPICLQGSPWTHLSDYGNLPFVLNGQDLGIRPQPTEPVRIEVNVPATRLDLYIDERFKKSYPIAIGLLKYPTPIRYFNISMIIWNPWWIPPESDWALDAVKTPPGPRNPLGPVKLVMERAMRIHGTNAPKLIGRAVSHACIRMYSGDAQELAWEIQQRYSEKKDPALFKKYQRQFKRRGRGSFYVKLFEEVPVQIFYSQVERQEDRLLLHPNRYWRQGFREGLAEALQDQPEIVVDRKFIKKLNKLRRRRTVEVSLTEVRAWASGLSTPLNPHAGKALSSQPL